MAISSFLKNLRKKTGSESFKESKYAEPDHFISTGSYGLNRICSGDIHKGIPGGRSIIFAGPTGVGKSLIALNIAANAINENDYDSILYFDSEGGAPIQMIENLGCDPSKVEHILLESLEDATVKILSTYKLLQEEKEKNPNLRVLLIVDSLGALVPTKLYADANKGEQKFDQGARAKLCNALVKGCTIPALKSNCSIIFLNHIYDGPEMYPSKIKNQSGGHGLQYMATLSIQCTKKLEKPEDKKEEEFYGGTNLRFFTTKNRLARPFIETSIFIDFKKGFTSKYEGLVEASKKLGFLVQEGAYYICPSFDGKKRYLKEILKRDDIWDTFLEDFNVKSQEDLQYSKKELETIKKEDAEEELEIEN